MNTLKTIGSVWGSIIIMLIASIVAQSLASFIAGVAVPAGICNIIAGIVYVVVSFFLLKVFSEKILKLKMSSIGMHRFSIGTRWFFVGVLLPATVKAVYLSLFSGNYVFNEMDKGQIFSVLSAGIVFIGIASGFVEEMVFRGVILNVLKEKWNTNVSVLLPSVLFGLLHIIGADLSFADSLLVVVAGTMVGIMFSVIAIESGSVWNSGIVHSIWNIIILGGGLSISDKFNEGSVMTYVLDTKHFVFTGGEFGIEASAIALLGYCIVTLVVICMIKKNKCNYNHEAVK